MAKFGELIKDIRPVIFAFYDPKSPDLKKSRDNWLNLAAMFGDYVKVVKIDMSKNTDLSEALRIKEDTFMLYHHFERQGVFKSRKPAEIERLIKQIKNYI